MTERNICGFIWRSKPQDVDTSQSHEDMGHEKQTQRGAKAKV